LEPKAHESSIVNNESRKRTQGGHNGKSLDRCIQHSRRIQNRIPGKGAQSAEFPENLPGFVEGFLYEKKDGESRYNFLTTAVWENDEAFENAKQAVAIEFQKQGYNPQETRKQLKIETVRSTYERSSY
jgi:heme-degrading monooxygenase HmoA